MEPHSKKGKLISKVELSMTTGLGFLIPGFPIPGSRDPEGYYPRINSRDCFFNPGILS